MKKKIGLLLIIGLMLLSFPVQAEIPGRTYFEIEDYYFYHIIEEGDTFYNLSQEFKVNLNQLQEWNTGLEVNDLQVGEKVKININEKLDYYIVQPADTLWEICQRHGLELDKVIEINDLDDPDYLLPDEVLLLPEDAVIARNKNIKITEFKQKDRTVNVSGLTRAFEANISYALETENGVILQDGFSTALAAGPYWGSFSIKLTDIPDEADYLAMFGISMKDGSRQDEVKLKLN